MKNGTIVRAQFWDLTGKEEEMELSRLRMGSDSDGRFDNKLSNRIWSKSE
jgi:hypothetical protein